MIIFASSNTLHAPARALYYLDHPASSTLGTLTEVCAREAMTVVVQRLPESRGESHFTIWAYTFAVNIALVAPRRERWMCIPLDRVLDGSDSPSSTAADEDGSPALRGVRSKARRSRSSRGHRAVADKEAAGRLRADPLDEMVGRWGSHSDWQAPFGVGATVARGGLRGRDARHR